MSVQADPYPLSLNQRAGALADAMIAESRALRLGVARGPAGEVLVDCGHRQPGSFEAGLHLARIALSGLGEVALVPSCDSLLPWSVLVRTSQPWLACLGSQYAGWHLSGPDGVSRMGSGPARALARREPIFEELPHRETADRAVLVLEGDTPPADATDVARACALAPDRVTLLHAPTGSPAGMVQIASRVLECAVQKARGLAFPMEDIQDAMGCGPVGLPHPDTRLAMGRANDAIIYAGRAHLLVTGEAGRARELARALPSCTASDWGRSFAEVFASVDGNFAHIDAGLFSPAEILVTALKTGETFTAGRAEPERLRAGQGLVPL
ncbi:methenyltetrahydromethanopterin cyclohydrolase [Rubellimicrobium roseum]|uniref:Methenyltetrahydromethanopterin cyclohydrolase n=2 Tax=Rubellimicrobium roseum TaxID=687525 RepID=A0A5C4NBZ4_9RHOB|nr:methenyltetrahydromethanopterin cyclohydrolase [Rubellimicrobium roseum]